MPESASTTPQSGARRLLAAPSAARSVLEHGGPRSNDSWVCRRPFSLAGVVPEPGLTCTLLGASGPGGVLGARAPARAPARRRHPAPGPGGHQDGSRPGDRRSMAAAPREPRARGPRTTLHGPREGSHGGAHSDSPGRGRGSEPLLRRTRGTSAPLELLQTGQDPRPFRSLSRLGHCPGGNRSGACCSRRPSS